MNRFILRDEFNGGLVYDRSNKDYFFVDPVIVAILKDQSVISPPSLYSKLKNKHHISLSELLEILDTLGQMGLISADGIVQADMLNNRAVDGQLSAPIRVYYEITYGCNARCRHCYTSSSVRREDELTIYQMMGIIDQMKNMGSYRISIAGGEPLITDDFFRLVDYANQQNIDVSFSTNGTLITEEMAKRLSELKLRTISVSLDGATPESNDRVRGHGMFHRTIKGIAQLKAHYKGKVAIRTTLMSTNIHEIGKLVELAESLECALKFNSVRENGRGCRSAPGRRRVRGRRFSWRAFSRPRAATRSTCRRR